MERLTTSHRLCRVPRACPGLHRTRRIAPLERVSTPSPCRRTGRRACRPLVWGDGPWRGAALEAAGGGCKCRAWGRPRAHPEATAALALTEVGLRHVSAVAMRLSASGAAVLPGERPGMCW